MQLSFTFIGFLLAVCARGSPTTRRGLNLLEFGSLPNEELLLDSNAIPLAIQQYLNSYFSQLTIADLRALLTSGQWAKEMPFEIQDELGTENRHRNYEELYRDFLNSKLSRV